ncbi:MAG: SMI1/KNR4 family protein [Myxococcaceae bacterium]|nr:SMI1/KNR4 family protein [Myxococcaceae bacterium]
MAATGDHQALHAAFQKRAADLRELGAQHLVDNLQAGAKPLALARLEQKLGFPLPKVLRAWWLLHDGEKKPAQGFGGSFHLLPVAWVLNERVTTLKRLERLRARPETWPASNTADDERASSQWIPLAARKGASVVMNARSGRVFECSDDDPALRLLAESVVGWFVALAEQGVFEEDGADEE